MDELLAGLRAAAEATRIRILFALSHGELNVSELTQILGQSQPRVSRHLKLMAEAGLLVRHKEGNWVLFRLRDQSLGGALAQSIVDLLPAGDPLLARDIARLEDIRVQRAEMASRYFSSNAGRWEMIRSLHVREDDVRDAMLRLAGPASVNLHLDLGTGTGSVLRTFAPRAKQSIGIDSSREMLAIARAGLEKSDFRNPQVRHGDIYALPVANGFSDFITIHQVLHYLDDPGRALGETARGLTPGGRLLIVDFAPHELEALRAEHAHRRLGIASEQMGVWLQRAGLRLMRHSLLPPPEDQTGLTVSLWLADKPVSVAATPNVPLAGTDRIP